MRVTVLGSGTSAGIPTLGCRCRVCTSPDPKNKRMRASIYIETGCAKILVDCGPDFRTQAIACGVHDVHHVLITHTHADHVNGLDDLRSFSMVHGHAVHVYATEESLVDIRERFAYCFRPAPPGGGIPNLELHTIEVGRAFMIEDVPVLPLQVFHGEWPIIGFRFGAFAYFTDVSRMPDETIAALQGVQKLITSALRHRPHQTHMSLREALKVAGQVGAPQAWFTHMCHDLEHWETMASLPPGRALLYDGLSFEAG